jgi:hypothetical protein
MGEVTRAVTATVTVMVRVVIWMAGRRRVPDCFLKRETGRRVNSKWGMRGNMLSPSCR